MYKIILFAFVLGCFSIAKAQTNFGPKAGLNLARLSGDEGEKIKLRPSFHAGGFVSFKLDEKWAIQPEIYYSSQGAKEDINFNQDGNVVSTIEITQRLDYLILPVLATYDISEKFFLEAGPQIGFLLNATGKSSGAVVIEDIEIDEFITKTDVALNLGIGYRFTPNIFANIRFVSGLININDVEAIEADDPDFEGTVANQKNQVFQLSLGYAF